MKPSVALERHRAGIRAAVSRRRMVNPRVFGSVVRGEDREDSDLDLLVDTLPGTDLFDLSGLHNDLIDLLGVPVSLVTPGGLPRQFRDEVLAAARPV